MLIRRHDNGVVTVKDGHGESKILLGEDWLLGKQELSEVTGITPATAARRISEYIRGFICCDKLFCPAGYSIDPWLRKKNLMRKVGAKKKQTIKSKGGRHSAGSSNWEGLSSGIGKKQKRALAAIKPTALDEIYGVGPVGKGAAYVSFNGEG